MPPHRAADATNDGGAASGAGAADGTDGTDGTDAAAATPSAAQPVLIRALLVLWPAFVSAGAMVMLIFAAVDPSLLHTSGGQVLELSRTSVYSLSFFVLWTVIAASAAVTQWLSRSPVQEEAEGKGADRRL